MRVCACAACMETHSIAASSGRLLVRRYLSPTYMMQKLEVRSSGVLHYACHLTDSRHGRHNMRSRFTNANEEEASTLAKSRQGNVRENNFLKKPANAAILLPIVERS